MENIYDVIILGSGPAGCAAGIYATRYLMKTLIIGKDYGMAGETHRVDNYPGIPGTPGLELAQKFVDHATSLGAEVVFDVVVRAEMAEEAAIGGKRLFKVTTSGGSECFGKSIIIALGGMYKKLDIPGEEKYTGKGVSYCATCDAAFYKDKTACVIGGADSAVGAAILLSKFAKKVYVFYRKEQLRAKEALAKELMEKPNVEIVYSAAPLEILGDSKDGHVTGLRLDVKGEKKNYDVDGIFVEIGYVPNNEITGYLKAAVDENGYIKVDEHMATSAPGVFAAGDITSASLVLQQIITACAQGAIAATSAYKYVKSSK